MEKYIIQGGNRLYGSIGIQSAKNSILPIIAGSILTDEKVTIRNCPDILDVKNMIKILENLGSKINLCNGTLEIDNSNMNSYSVDSKLAEKLRSSIFLLSPILIRFKRAKISFPGGCDIGSRPVNLHIDSLKKLGVKAINCEDDIECTAEKLRGSDVYLDFQSVGATENLILASIMVKGYTTIYNCAKEPEIKDLCNFLNKMGAKIQGAGSSVIKIKGVKKLHGVDYSPIADRIEAGTFLIACAGCGGEVELNNINMDSNNILIKKLLQNGCKISVEENKIKLFKGDKSLGMGLINTLPYPNFPTDLQSPVCSLASISEGRTIIVENIFENRFKYINELKKMGADIEFCENYAIINGVRELQGNNLVAFDLRAGAAMVLASLFAKGKSTVSNIHHIERGYSNFVEKISLLGGKIIKE